MSFYWREIFRDNRRIPPYLKEWRLELLLKLPQQSTEWQVGILMSVQQFSFYSFTITKIICQSLESWRKTEDKHTQGSQIQTSALSRDHIKWIICHITQLNFNWEWRHKYIHFHSLCSHVTLVSWRFSFPQRTFQTQASLSGAASQCLGKHKLVWHCCHMHHPSSRSHCLKLQRNMENMIYIYSPLLEATEDSFMKLLLNTEQKCRRKCEKLSLAKTAETLHESAKLFQHGVGNPPLSEPMLSSQT